MVITLQPRKPANCPTCDAAIAPAIEGGPAAPKPGSFTICWQCRTILRFTKRLQLRMLDEHDRRVLDVSPDTRNQLDQLRIAIAVRVHG